MGQIENKIKKLYRAAFELYLNRKINFSWIDAKIEESNLFFNPSKIATKNYINSNLGSKYFYCMNEFFIENLNREEVEFLSMKDVIDEEVLKMVENSFQRIITKENVKTITYGQATPETIIPNGTLVFGFFYGKNKCKLEKEQYIENMKKQKLFLQELQKGIESICRKQLDIPCRVIIRKVV